MFKGLRVLIVGDIMLDHYIFGKADRLSPEAPVPVVTPVKEDYRPGGAANVALNVVALDAEVELCSIIGDDREGEILLDKLREAGISTNGITGQSSRPTTVKTRIFAQGQQLLRLDKETTQEPPAAVAAEIVSKFDQLLNTFKPQVILLQDYNKGLLSKEFIHCIIQKAKEQQIPTVADPKKDNFLAYNGIDLFKPNLREISQAIGAPLTTTDEDLIRADKFIREQLQHRYTVITLGEKGMYCQTESSHFRISAHPRSVADVCGAGDTALAVLGLGLAASLAIEEIIRIANIAASQVCESVGVVPVDRERLEREI